MPKKQGKKAGEGAGVKAKPRPTTKKAKPKGAAKKPAKVKAAPKPAAPAFTSVHADLPKREPVWNERRVAVVTAMRELGAMSATTAVTASAIAQAAGIPEAEVFRVKVILDVYRVNELVHNGYAQTVRVQGSRELSYFLTKAGQTTTFPAKSATTEG